MYHKDTTIIAPEGRDAHSADNTIQAVRRSVVADPYDDLRLGEMRHSVSQKIFLSYGHTILLKKGSVFFSKRAMAMMFLLFGDIPDYHILVPHTIGKPSILFGPSIEQWEGWVRLEPFAGGNLEFLYKLGHGQCGWQGNKKMHMVWHPADTVELTANIIYKNKDLGIQISLVFLCNRRYTLMCAEDDMVRSLGVTHAKITYNLRLYCVEQLCRISTRCHRGCYQHHHTAPIGLCGVNCVHGRVSCLRHVRTAKKRCPIGANCAKKHVLCLRHEIMKLAPRRGAMYKVQLTPYKVW